MVVVAESRVKTLYEALEQHVEHVNEIVDEVDEHPVRREQWSSRGVGECCGYSGRRTTQRSNHIEGRYAGKTLCDLSD